MAVALITRSKWGARPPRATNTLDAWEEPTAHWNGPTITVKGETRWDHAYCAGLVRGIQNFHMDGRGWYDIAYNFLICPHGYCFEGRGLRTRSGANGTTATNKASHAVCYLGGEGNLFAGMARQAMRACFEWITRDTNARPGGQGHRDHKATACPGDTIYLWVHDGMPVAGSPTPVGANAEEDDDMAPQLAWLQGPGGKGSHAYLISGDGIHASHVPSTEELELAEYLGVEWIDAAGPERSKALAPVWWKARTIHTGPCRTVPG